MTLYKSFNIIDTSNIKGITVMSNIIIDRLEMIRAAAEKCANAKIEEEAYQIYTELNVQYEQNE